MHRRRFLALVGTAGTAGCLASQGRNAPKGCAATSEYSLGSDRLSIESRAENDLTATTTLIDQCTDETVLDRTRTFSRGDSVTLDEHFDPGTPYRFVLAIEGELQFDRTIADHEGYWLAIRSEDEVEVTMKIEA